MTGRVLRHQTRRDLSSRLAWHKRFDIHHDQRSLLRIEGNGFRSCVKVVIMPPPESAQGDGRGTAQWLNALAEVFDSRQKIIEGHSTPSAPGTLATSSNMRATLRKNRLTSPY